MQIGPYVIDEYPLGKPDLFFAHHVAFETGGIVLIKAFGPRKSEDSSRLAFREESVLVSRLKISNFRVIDVGRDYDLDLDYYAAQVPGRFSSMSFQSCGESERLQLLLGVGTAIRELNQKGVAYRDFGPAAFGHMPDRILPYDFARATRFDTDRVRALPDALESFDPPEAGRAEYDALKGEAYGFGHLIRQAGLKSPAALNLAERLMSTRPDIRPKIEDAIEELRLLHI